MINLHSVEHTKNHKDSTVTQTPTSACNERENDTRDKDHKQEKALLSL